MKVVPKFLSVTNAILMLIMLQMSPAIDVWLFLVPNAHPRPHHGIGNGAKQTHQKKSGLGQGKAQQAPERQLR